MKVMTFDFFDPIRKRIREHVGKVGCVCRTVAGLSSGNQFISVPCKLTLYEAHM
jgi:hypothetical protein